MDRLIKTRTKLRYQPPHCLAVLTCASVASVKQCCSFLCFSNSLLGSKSDFSGFLKD